MNKPTDAEIIALADETRTGEPGRGGYILPISFARAVLARWGTPPAVAERLEVTEAECEAAVLELEIEDLHTTPQPVEREPLTQAQAKALVLKYGNDPLHLVYQVEVAHGIKGD